ncbi:hypothetical protein N7456_007299 [Penicillium angulare]|uniref:Uncharacterized protein n=1 Tax=Penicillium angulare TaxID=116970 RepID=A0A9W9FAG0_9EURO|nr:hypothetical protein N7456_007299 [Penicillium angulare]
MDIAVLLGWESAKKKGSHNQWPYISLKDLADKKAGILPLMLHSRANNPPGNFWNIDEGSWQASILSWDSWFPMLDGYGMIFGGQNTPEEYGRILKVDDKTRSGRGTDAAQGIPLLKIQARLYHFLVCCCVDIMHDQKQLEDLDNLPENPDPTVQLRPVPPEAIRQGFLDEPYHRIPIVIEDIDEILESLEERRAIAVDHLLSLRDDPTYFHMCLHELADHTPEMLKDQDGRRVPGFGSEEFWSKTISSFVFLSINSTRIWSTLVMFVQELKTNMEENPDALHQEHLPHVFQRLLLVASKTLRRLTKLLIQHTYESAVCSEKIRDNYYVENSAGGQRAGEYALLCSGWRFSVKRSQMYAGNEDWFSIIKALQTLKDSACPVFDTPILNELDQHMSDSSARGKALNKRMSRYVKERFNDIILASQCCMQINRFQPWAGSGTFLLDNDLNFKVGLPRQNMRDTGGLSKFEKTIIKEFKDRGITEMARPFFAKKIDYSIKNLLKDNTQKTTEQNQQIENQLDTFWQNLDTAVKDTMGNEWGMDSDELFPGPGPSRFRTPDWEPEEHQTILRGLFRALNIPFKGDNEFRPSRASKRSAEVMEGVEEQANRWLAAQQASGSRDVLVPFTSIKRRKNRHESKEDIPAVPTQQQQSVPAPEAPIFELDRRAMSAVFPLFYVEGGDQSTQLRWADFLRFMDAIGFEGTKAKVGSGFKFKPPPSLDNGRTISFHMPHPENSYVGYYARAMGSRLTRDFGLTAKNFIEKIRG